MSNQLAQQVKLCFVSPELERRDENIEQYKRQIMNMGIEFDAICAKFDNIKRWSQNS